MKGMLDFFHYKRVEPSDNDIIEKKSY